MNRVSLGLASLIIIVASLVTFCSAQSSLDGTWVRTESVGNVTSDSQFEIKGENYIASSCTFHFSQDSGKLKIDASSGGSEGSYSSSYSYSYNSCRRNEMVWDFERPADDEIVLKKDDSKHTYKRLKADDIETMTATQLQTFVKSHPFKVKATINVSSGRASVGQIGNETDLQFSESYLTIPAGTTVSFDFSSHYGWAIFHLNSRSVRAEMFRSSAYSMTGAEFKRWYGSHFEMQ